MFGLGFTEILFIAVIAIIFLGPDKLPEAMVQIAKLFNSFKKTVNDAKASFENEIHINELKEEALSYKRALDNDISGFKNSLSNPLDDLNEALSDLDDSGSVETYKPKIDTSPPKQEVKPAKKTKKEKAAKKDKKKKSSTKDKDS